MPTGPKSETPPKTEKRITTDGIFIFLPTIIGLKKLSTNPTIKIAQMMRPITCGKSDVTKRKIITGIVMSDVPKVGTKDNIEPEQVLSVIQIIKSVRHPKFHFLV